MTTTDIPDLLGQTMNYLILYNLLKQILLTTQKLHDRYTSKPCWICTYLSVNKYLYMCICVFITVYVNIYLIIVLYCLFVFHSGKTDIYRIWHQQWFCLETAFLNGLFSFYIYESFTCMDIFVPYVYSVCGNQKKVLGPLDLGSQADKWAVIWEVWIKSGTSVSTTPAFKHWVPAAEVRRLRERDWEHHMLDKPDDSRIIEPWIRIFSSS